MASLMDLDVCRSPFKDEEDASRIYSTSASAVRKEEQPTSCTILELHTNKLIRPLQHHLANENYSYTSKWLDTLPLNSAPTEDLDSNQNKHDSFITSSTFEDIEQGNEMATNDARREHYQTRWTYTCKHMLIHDDEDPLYPIRFGPRQLHKTCLELCPMCKEIAASTDDSGPSHYGKTTTSSIASNRNDETKNNDNDNENDTNNHVSKKRRLLSTSEPDADADADRPTTTDPLSPPTPPTISSSSSSGLKTKQSILFESTTRLEALQLAVLAAQRDELRRYAEYIDGKKDEEGDKESKDEHKDLDDEDGRRGSGDGDGQGEEDSRNAAWKLFERCDRAWAEKVWEVEKRAVGSSFLHDGGNVSVSRLVVSGEGLEGKFRFAREKLDVLFRAHGVLLGFGSVRGRRGDGDAHAHAHAHVLDHIDVDVDVHAPPTGNNREGDGDLESSRHGEGEVLRRWRFFRDLGRELDELRRADHLTVMEMEKRLEDIWGKLVEFMRG